MKDIRKCGWRLTETGCRPVGDKGDDDEDDDDDDDDDNDDDDDDDDDESDDDDDTFGMVGDLSSS